MISVFPRQAVYSQLEEAISYEVLWARSGATVKRVADLFREHGGRPSDVLEAIEDSETAELRNRIAEMVIPRLRHTEVITADSYQYPRGLRASRHPIALFYARGNVDLLSGNTVSIVGTRKPSDRARRLTEHLVTDLMNENVVVVSGLARGIDSIAHNTTINRSGATIAVIGTPIDRCYPPENQELQEFISREHLLISHVPMYRYEHEPFSSHRIHFPWRNDTMAAISHATVIVEAGESSGTLTQAASCLYQGKPVLLHRSLLDRSDLSWPRRFLERGAQVFNRASDVIDLVRAAWNQKDLGLGFVAEN